MVDDDAVPRFTRVQLERIAFGPAATEDERTAARNELARLAAADADVEITPASIEELETPDVTVDFDQDAAQRTAIAPETTPPRSRLRRRLAAAAIGAVAAVAIVTGLWVAGAHNHSPSAGSTADAHLVANPAAALKTLLRPQTAADTDFPMRMYAATLDIQPASIHFALRMHGGDTLWVGRSDHDLCMMWTSQPAHGSVQGGSHCVSPQSFAKHGLSLKHGDNVWQWDGHKFTVADV
jgi:hypothetical protein